MYEFILFNSYTLYRGLNGQYKCSVFEHFPNLIYPKRGFIAVIHHLELWDQCCVPRERIITLGDICGGDCVVNPHKCGEVQLSWKQPNRAHFIVVGAMEPWRRNVRLLFDSALHLLDVEEENFYISMVGRGQVERPPRLAKFIEMLGEATYREMYEKMENATFFLPLLDPDNPEHDRYLVRGFSGSFMLAYCFRKPMLIAEKFAAKYGLNEGNSIIYKNNSDFPEAMRRAIKMDPGEYERMRNNLGALADSIAANSINNLQRILNS